MYNSRMDVDPDAHAVETCSEADVEWTQAQPDQGLTGGEYRHSPLRSGGGGPQADSPDIRGWPELELGDPQPDISAVGQSANKVVSACGGNHPCIYGAGCQICKDDRVGAGSFSGSGLAKNSYRCSEGEAEPRDSRRFTRVVSTLTQAGHFDESKRNYITKAADSRQGMGTVRTRAGWT